MHEHGRSLVKKLAGKPFVIVGVNSDSNRDKVKELSAKNGPAWRSFWDGGDGAIQASYGVPFIPSLCLIDAHGILRYKLGLENISQLDGLIDGLLREAASIK